MKKNRYLEKLFKHLEITNTTKQQEYLDFCLNMVRSNLISYYKITDENKLNEYLEFYLYETTYGNNKLTPLIDKFSVKFVMSELFKRSLFEKITYDKRA